MGELKKNRLFALDITKFIASLFVIFIHCNFYGDLGVAIKSISRFAVPFFFICSGFFLYGNSSEKILNKIIHILKLLLFSSVLYFAFNIALNFAGGGIEGVLEYFSNLINLKSLLKLLLFNMPLSYTHLWYLLASIYVYFIYYVITKLKIPDKIVFAAAFFLIFAHLVIWQLNLSLNITENTFYVRNFLFIGFPFVTIGVFIKKHQHKIPKISTVNLILLLLLGAGLCVASRFIFGNKSLPLGAIIISVSLFTFALNVKLEKCGKFVKNAGTYSTYIYIFHQIFNYIIVRAFHFAASRIGINAESMLWTNIMPIIVCVVTIAFVIIFCNIQQRFFAFLNNLKHKKDFSKI